MAGKGTYTFADRRVLSGVFADDCLAVGSLVGPQGSYTYEGSFNTAVLAQQEGVGTCSWAGGRAFTGAWSKGRVFNGKMTHTDGSTWEGEFNETGQMHGRGKLTFSDGKVCEGMFLDDKPKECRVVNINYTFDGTFDGNGLYHGNGTYSTAEYDFVGNFENGSPVSGNITYTEAFPTDGLGKRQKYAGAVDGKYFPHGSGELTWKNGNVAHGEFASNVLAGTGKLIEKGKLFSGRFVMWTLREGTIEYGTSDLELAKVWRVVAHLLMLS
jgi:hypothetical protein